MHATAALRAAPSGRGETGGGKARLRAMVRVSVVIPSFNDAVLLRGCLAALAVQTRPADEIVVVDNDSTDDTAEVAARAGARVVREPIRGIFPATAAGFDAASGDLLLRLDADSIAPPDWIARVEAAFVSHPRLDALSGPGRFYGGNAVVRWVAEHLYIGAYSHIVRVILGHPVLFGSNLALRATVWHAIRERVHRHIPHVHDDFDIAINLEPHMHVRFDPTLVVGVSARPFSSPAGLLRRLDWAFGTMAINHREQSLFARRRAWRAAARTRRAAARTRRTLG
jgi:glycosyltransferase involved in cell wall biosynthesis